MPLTPGRRLGPYEILAPLGAGGMGEVYRSRDTRLGREVAVKVLPAHFADSDERRARFVREAKAISALNHPNICVLHDVGREGDVDYLVMELIEGETLASRLSRGRLPLAEVTRVGAQIAGALERAHGAGVIHRDLKPGNVMLTASGAKLMDFGLARRLAPSLGATHPADVATSSVVLTGERTLLGTLPYMAPEQLEGNETDARTDIWALGCLLHEAATGRRAFPGTSDAEVTAQIFAARTAPPSAVRRELPAEFDRLVAGCLARAPEERWASAHDVALLLRHLDASAAATATGRPGRRRALPLWLAVGALLALAAVELIRHSARPPAPTVRFQIAPPPGNTFDFDVADTRGFAVSPDGRQIAFVASDSAGERHVWLRPVAEQAARPLPGTDGALSLFWSPDGGSLGFFVIGALKRYDFRSEGVVPICALASPAAYYAGTWGRGGQIVFASAQEGVIYKVSQSGGSVSPIVRPVTSRGEAGCGWPSFLPDGRHFLYFARYAEWTDSLRVADVEGGARGVMPIDSRAELIEPGILLHVREGTLVAQRLAPGAGGPAGAALRVADALTYFQPSGGAEFSASPGGVLVYQLAAARSRLAWFDRDGGESGRLGKAADYVGDLTLSPDGRRLLSTRMLAGSGMFNLWIIELDRGTETRLTSDGSAELAGVWLPGMKSIVCSNSTSKLPQLVRHDLDTGVVTAVRPSSGFQMARDVSPDGQWLLYSERVAPAGWDLWALPLANGEPRRLSATPASESEARFSPDGKAISYVAFEAGSSELYVAPFPGPGERIRVSLDGAIKAKWGPNGRLDYMTPDSHLMEVDVRTAPSLEVGTPRIVFHIPSRQWIDFVVVPDGRFLAIVPEVLSGELPLDVIVGWNPPR